MGQSKKRLAVWDGDVRISISIFDDGLLSLYDEGDPQGSKERPTAESIQAVEADKEKGSTQRRAARLHVLYPYFPERAVSAESKLKKNQPVSMPL
jgi:hypothetical protein